MIENKKNSKKYIPQFAQSLYNRIKASDIGSRMARGAFWTFTGVAIGKFLVLVAGIVVANILGKEQYGELGLVRSTVNMFVIFGVAGLGITATKYIAEFKNNDKEKVTSIYILTNGFAIIVGFIVSLCVFLSATYLAENTLSNPNLVDEIRLGSLLLFLTVVNSAQTGVLAGFEDFKSTAITTFYGSLTEFIFMIVGAYYYGVIGALIGFGLGYLVMAIFFQIYIERNLKIYSIPKGLKFFRKKDISILYKFSAPAALSTFMIGPIYWVVRTMLANTPNGYGELGIYEAADQWRIIILFIPQTVSKILLPIFTDILSKKEYDKYWKAIKYNFWMIFAITVSISTFFSCFAGSIMNLYGKEYEDIWTFVLLMYSTVFTSIADLLGWAIVSRGKVWVDLAMNIVWAIMFVFLVYVFLNVDMGARSLGLALILSYMFKSTILYIYLYSIRNSKKIIEIVH